MPTFAIEPNERITYRIAHEDEDVIVVEKPPRRVTQPGRAHEHDSLLNGLFARYGAQLQNLGKSRDYGLLHRLDKDASGLLLVALRPRAYDTLREAFAAGDITKMYWALVRGCPNKPKGIIRRPILEEGGDESRPGAGRASSRSGKMKLARISSAGKPAVTAYRVLGSSPAGSLVECRAVTGRLHQVRLHLASIRCPIFGDRFYAPEQVAAAAPRLALHAHRLAFTHPTTGERVDIRSRWPSDLRSLLSRLKLDRPDLPQRARTDPEGRPEPGP